MNDEFDVTVAGEVFHCVTTGSGSDLLIEDCYDSKGRAIEPDHDIYEAAILERIERQIGAAESML